VTGEGGEAARHACRAAAMVLVRAVRREMAQRWEDDDGGELDSWPWLCALLRRQPAKTSAEERGKGLGRCRK
jgi:hypothetical protein